MTRLAALPTLADYDAAFLAEQAEHYPAVEAFEAAHGYAIDAHRLERAARVLACPVKVHAPNWQHGRVLYSALRGYLAIHAGPVLVVDIGTAKGFSALCCRWALDDAEAAGVVLSTDVIDPAERVRRNSVAEINGPLTLAELLSRWPESQRIVFRHGPGALLLETLRDRVHVAFVDGKHSEHEVGREAAALSRLQQAGDLVIFDDCQIPGVRLAVDRARFWYRIESLLVKPGREYGIGVRL